MMLRRGDDAMLTGDEAYPYLPTEFLVTQKKSPTKIEKDYMRRWNRANADSFAPLD